MVGGAAARAAPRGGGGGGCRLGRFLCLRACCRCCCCFSEAWSFPVLVACGQGCCIGGSRGRGKEAAAASAVSSGPRPHRPAKEAPVPASFVFFFSFFRLLGRPSLVRRAAPLPGRRLGAGRRAAAHGRQRAAPAAVAGPERRQRRWSRRIGSFVVFLFSLRPALDRRRGRPRRRGPAPRRPGPGSAQGPRQRRGGLGG